MSAKSTASHYGSVAIAIHWTSAAAVILAFVLGWIAADVVAAPPPPGLLIVHVAAGILVLALTLLRIVWWLAFDRLPSPLAGQPRRLLLTAKIVHLGLYALLALMAVSGITTMVLSGAMPILLAGGPVPDFSELGPRLAHGAMSKLLLVLLVLHVGAALYHQFIRRDNLMTRMGARR